MTKGQGTEKIILFVLTRFRFMEVLFHLFRYHWGKENRSLLTGLVRDFVISRFHCTSVQNTFTLKVK